MDKKTIIKIANLAKLEIKDDKLNDIASSLEKILNLVGESRRARDARAGPLGPFSRRSVGIRRRRRNRARAKR